MEDYSLKLQKLLSATGWSQETLAKHLDVSFVSLNSWVNQKASPREAAREKIDELASEVLGADAIDENRLKEMKKAAEATRCSARKLISDKTLLEHFTTSFTYHSNATEGSTMTEKDVEAVVFQNQTLKNRTSLEQREAINHQTALYFLLDELEEQGENFEFSVDLIKAVHLRLMNGIISDAGNFREHGVRIRGSFVPLANYMKVPELVKLWSKKANEETLDKIHALASLHAEFERIHPFSDGNGREGRLLLFAMALKFGLVPPVLRKSRRLAYYKYLELAQTRDLSDPLELFISEEIISTAEKLGI
ncbi:Fic family protein [Candidatus Saccharibacteria bacterium]|nr:Fic family protein [Candidatus Saccharibacteria bacterium]